MIGDWRREKEGRGIQRQSSSETKGVRKGGEEWSVK
jgi:hypothetical protein